MSILGILDIGRTAMFATQTALNVTSNNIANANNADYARQEVVLSIAAPGRIGNTIAGRGVTVDGIRSHYDRFLQSQLLGQQSSMGRSSILDQMWGQVEQVMNESQGYGLASPLADFFNAWNDVAANPESLPNRQVLLNRADALLSSAQSMDQNIAASVRQANAGIVSTTAEINSIAADIARMNSRISQVEAGTDQVANDLRDQRSGLLSRLANLVDFNTTEDATGSLTVRVGMRTLVDGSRTNALSTVVNSEQDQDVYLDGVNITNTVGQGQLSGLIAARADIEVNALTPLRQLVASVIQEVNRLHQNGVGLDSSTGSGFFTDLTIATTANTPGTSIAASITNPGLLTLDEYRFSFDAGGNYSVTSIQTGAVAAAGAYVSGSTISLPGVDVVISGAVTSASSFTVSPLTTAISGSGLAITDPRQVAAASSPLQLPGDNSNAVRIARLTEAAVSTLGNRSFGSFYGGIVSSTGVMAKAASDSRSFDENLQNQLQNRRDAVSGVSLDEEAANLIRFQRAYEASARLIRTADELLQTVLNL